MSTSNLRQLVEFKLPEFIPFNSESAIFDFEVIKQENAHSWLSVLVYPEEIVAEYIEAVENAGFTVKSTELETISMARSIIPKKNQENKQTSLVLDIGNNKIGISILKGAIPVFSTTMKTTTGEYFKELFEKMNKTKPKNDEELSDWKFKKGFVFANKGDVEKYINEQLKDLKKIINFYSEKEESNFGAIKKVYVTGGNAATKGVDSILSSVVGVQVNFGNTWQNMFDISKSIPNIDRQKSPMYSTVAGLILKDLI